MKRLHLGLLFFVLLLSVTAVAQPVAYDSLFITDAINTNITILEVVNQDGFIVLAGKLLNQKKHGTWVARFDDGLPKWIISFESDVPNGYQAFFDESGNIMFDAWMKDGKYNGWLSTYTSGVLLSQVYYYDDKEHGAAIYYYPGGWRHKVMSYTLGELDGLYQEYYETGYMKIQGRYLAGKQIGVWYQYDELGQIEKAEEFLPDGRIKDVTKQEKQQVKEKN